MAGTRAGCQRHSLCFSRRDAISLWTWIIRSARTRRCSASSRRNPKSRNTLPVDGVTLSFIVNPILPRDRRDAAAARKPGIVAARGPHPARASSSRVSRTRAARRWPRRTWRHTQPDVPIPYEPESLGRPAQRWSWVSSPVDPALAEHASVPRPRCAGHPAGRHGCQSSKSRASGEARRTCDNMQVFVYSVKSTGSSDGITSRSSGRPTRVRLPALPQDVGFRRLLLTTAVSRIPQRRAMVRQRERADLAV